MDILNELTDRNRSFSSTFDAGEMPALPKLGTMILTCVDARVDPAHVLGLVAELYRGLGVRHLVVGNDLGHRRLRTLAEHNLVPLLGGLHVAEHHLESVVEHQRLVAARIVWALDDLAGRLRGQ